MQLPDIPWSLVAAFAATLSAALLTLLILRGRKKVHPPLVLRLDPGDGEGVDQILARVLNQISEWLPGTAFHAYWINSEGTGLVLRASISQSSNPHVAPDYSGLVVFETPNVLLGLPLHELTGPTLGGSGVDYRLDIPLGRLLLIRVQLRHRAVVPPPVMERLREACEIYPSLVTALHEWLKGREELNHAQSLLGSAQMALDTTLRPERAVGLLLRVGRQLLGARTQCAVIDGPDTPLCLALDAEGRELGDMVIRREVNALVSLPSAPDLLPGAALGPLSARFNACVRVPVLDGEQPLGCFYYFLEEAANLDGYRTAVLTTLGDRTAHLLTNQWQMQAASESYSHTLQALTNAMDGLSPHSVGHSDRIARYARLIARQLGLSDAEVEAIALAAFFHDVGMIVIDPKVVQKPDRLTPEEYELVKTHAELGSHLVTAIQAALPLAPMVIGHHERWDGRGYPRGLKGEAIPLGARILAVADLFEAKTTVRAHRSPLPFYEAVQQVKASGGTHLDPQVTEAFEAVWSELASNNSTGMPLIRCWEAKQLPANICAGCPNRVTEVVKCWEQKEKHCSRHGDACETCFLYTETAARGFQSDPADSSSRGEH